MPHSRQRGSFLSVALLDIPESNPAVPVAAVYGLLRCGKAGVGEGADRDGDAVRQALRLPEHRSSAMRAEVEDDIEAAVGGPAVERRRAARLDRVAREEGGDAVRAARAPLAFDAMAERDAQGLARAARADVAAGAGRGPDRHRMTIAPPGAAGSLVRLRSTAGLNMTCFIK